MGKVIYLYNREKAAINCIKSSINSDDVDEYEIVSFVAFKDNPFDQKPLGELLKVKAYDLYEKQRIYSNYYEKTRAIVNKIDDKIFFMKTHMQYDKSFHFYKLNFNEVDIELATELGFGVAKINYDFMLYPTIVTDDSIDILIDFLMIQTYFQLLYPDIIDNNLKIAFKRHYEIISDTMAFNKNKNLKKLRQLLCN